MILTICLRLSRCKLKILYQESAASARQCDENAVNIADLNGNTYSTTVPFKGHHFCHMLKDCGLLKFIP